MGAQFAWNAQKSVSAGTETSDRRHTLQHIWLRNGTAFYLSVALMSASSAPAQRLRCIACPKHVSTPLASSGAWGGWEGASDETPMQEGPAKMAEPEFP